VRLQAWLLLLLAGTSAGLPTVVQAVPQGQMGTTSKGSIAIRVSVHPQVQLRVVAADALNETVIVATPSARDVCVLDGNSFGNYAVLLQSGDRASVNELPVSEAATSFCRSAGAASARSPGFRLPPTRPPGSDPYTLLIVPE
jgi:hypothetical protein